MPSSCFHNLTVPVPACHICMSFPFLPLSSRLSALPTPTYCTYLCLTSRPCTCARYCTSVLQATLVQNVKKKNSFSHFLHLALFFMNTPIETVSVAVCVQQCVLIGRASLHFLPLPLSRRCLSKIMKPYCTGMVHQCIFRPLFSSSHTFVTADWDSSYDF